MIKLALLGVSVLASFSLAAFAVGRKVGVHEAFRIATTEAPRDEHLSFETKNKFKSDWNQLEAVDGAGTALLRIKQDEQVIRITVYGQTRGWRCENESGVVPAAQPHQ